MRDRYGTKILRLLRCFNWCYVDLDMSSDLLKICIGFILISPDLL